MLRISDEEILNALEVENPWWRSGVTGASLAELPRRSYFKLFSELATQTEVRRSVVLLGPRRVGKTVMIQQLIDELLRRGQPPESLLYISLDRPLYNGLTLERVVDLRMAHLGNVADEELWFFFDEVQYLNDWERELKVLTDIRPNCRFVASGSAAAALRAKSTESGAGRFTEFLLPPLTFDEFLRFQRSDSAELFRLIVFADDGFADPTLLREIDVLQLNVLFERYCSFGGFPEAVFSERVQRNMDRFIREDIIEKVLLRDLPSLYGISDTRELYSLFTTLALNTGQELSLESLSQTSAVAKNTIKRYIEYLEAAFLIKRVRRIDQSARRFQRATTFKVYLTNPSLRAALFNPLTQDDDLFGPVAETAVFSQWFHNPQEGLFHYARWNDGEIDMVNLAGPKLQPEWFVEVKWSNRHLTRQDEWNHISRFVAKHRQTLRSGLVTSRTAFGDRIIHGLETTILPTAVYAWMVGRNVVGYQRDEIVINLAEDDEPDLFENSE